MNIIAKKILLRAPVVSALVILIISTILGIHNATLYNPRHGFDGVDHQFYIQYVVRERNIPPPQLGKETHQPPVYYITAALVAKITGYLKSVQYINVVIFLLIVLVVGLGLHKIFKDKIRVIIGMYAVAALPMLNIFPPMVTNELLNTLFIISSVVSLVYLVSERSFIKIVFYYVWFIASFLMGFWTKVSIITVLPTALLVVVFLLIHLKSQRRRIIIISILAGVFLIAGSLPILMRSLGSGEHSSNLIYDITIKSEKRPVDFYFRLDWIPKIDMYNAQYYSMTGGAWNSFWSDGQNAITPFVSFHKKAFILWLVGFALFFICAYGLALFFKKNKVLGTVVNFFGLSTLAFFVYFNTLANHYSSARLTYVMGIVLPYAFGIAAASCNRRLKGLILLLLTIQFITMVSFFWIQPWWEVTK